MLMGPVPNFDFLFDIVTCLIFFRDFLININHIDHEESENRGPETLESILRAQELNVILIKSKFQREKDPSLGLKYFSHF